MHDLTRFENENLSYALTYLYLYINMAVENKRTSVQYIHAESKELNIFKNEYIRLNVSSRDTFECASDDTFECASDNTFEYAS